MTAVEHDHQGAFWCGTFLKSLEVDAVTEGRACAGDAASKTSSVYSDSRLIFTSFELPFFEFH